MDVGGTSARWAVATIQIYLSRYKLTYVFCMDERRKKKKRDRGALLLSLSGSLFFSAEGPKLEGHGSVSHPLEPITVHLVLGEGASSEIGLKESWLAAGSVVSMYSELRYVPWHLITRRWPISYEFYNHLLLEL